MIWLLSHIYDISLSWKSMGLNGEFVSDINHLGLAYLPLRVTIDVKRGEDSSDTGNKREGNKKKKKRGGYEWIVIRITHAESKTLGNWGKGGPRWEKITWTKRGGEERTWNDKKKKQSKRARKMWDWVTGTRTWWNKEEDEEERDITAIKWWISHRCVGALLPLGVRGHL